MNYWETIRADIKLYFEPFGWLKPHARHGGHFRRFGIEWDYNNGNVKFYFSISFYRWIWVWTRDVRERQSDLPTRQ